MNVAECRAIEQAIKNIEHARTFTKEIHDEGSRLTQDAALFLALQCCKASLDA